VRRAIPWGVLLLSSLLTSVAAPQNPTPPVPKPPRTTNHAAGRPLTIDQAEALGLKNNPQITVGKLQAFEAQEYYRETRSALLPQVSLDVTAVGAQEGSRLAAGYLTVGRMYSRVAGGATASQLITDFGRTSNLVSSSRYQAQAAEEGAVATKQQIILAVDQSFYNTLETKALLSVAQETVKARQVLVDQVQALTTAKLKSDLDLAFAKVDLARAELLLLDSQNNYDASLSILSAVLGFPELQDFDAVEPAMTVTPPAPDVAPLIQQALELRPEVIGMRDEVTAAEKFSRAEHDLFWPTVSGLGVVGQAPIRNENIPSWYGAAGVNVSIPVFNGFLFSARAKSADLGTEVKRKQLQDLQDNVARDVRNGWLDTGKAFQRLSLTRQLREQADLGLELAQARYKLGLSTIVEYTQAELQKTDADIQDTDAHYQYLLSQIVLAYDMGLTR
jgi:outer membrane protein